MAKNKYTKGRRIDNLLELTSLLKQGFWVYWNDKPRHPEIIWHMNYGVVEKAVTEGRLYIALTELP